MKKLIKDTNDRVYMKKKEHITKKYSSILLGVVVLITANSIRAEENQNAKDVSIQENENDEKASPIGFSGEALKNIEEDYTPNVKRLIIPPFYQEKTEKYKLQLFFPFYFGKKESGETPSKSFGLFPFYWQHRSSGLNIDVVFPLYTRVRTPKFKTDIVLQTYFKRGNEGYHFWLLPFVFIGKNKTENSTYQIVPPIFWRFTEEEKSFLLAGIFYLSKNKEDFDTGIPPLFFAGRNRYKTYKVILPPLFWRFTNEIAYETETIVPPFFFNTREEGWSFGAIPLLYLARDKNWDKTFVFPFYYGSRWESLDKNGDKLGEGRTHIMPILLSYYKHGPGLSQGGAAIFYQWYWNEGDYINMYTPFVWRFGNERIQSRALLVPPLFFRKVSPVENKLMIGLLYWDFENKYKDRTVAVLPFASHSWSLYHKDWRTWVFPTFDIGADDQGSRHFRFHPLFYYGVKPDKLHLVVNPIYWHFKDKEDDNLIVFPFYWRFKDLVHEDTTTIFFPFWWKFDDPRRKNRAQLAFPFYWDFLRGGKDSRFIMGFPLYWQYRLGDRRTTGFLNVVLNNGNIKGNRFWTFNLFPLIAFGHPPAPDGAYWSFLSGLVEWRRQGRSKKMKLFWIPFNLGKK